MTTLHPWNWGIETPSTTKHNTKQCREFNMPDLDYLFIPIRDELLDRMCLGGDAVIDCLYAGPCGPESLPDCVINFSSVAVMDLPGPDRFFSELPAASLDCLVVNGIFHWLGLSEQLPNALRSLKPGGRLLFSTFGPDTLTLARQAWQAVDDLPHIHDFVDMHHLGDALVGSGFQRPIVDAEWLTIGFPGARALMSDLRGAGVTNSHPDRRRTLTGKGRIRRFISEFDAKKVDGDVCERVEIIYGVATKPDAVTAASPIPVQVNPSV